MKSCYTFLLLFVLKIHTIHGQSVSFSTSNLPIIKVNTNGKTIFNEPKILADMEIIYNGIGKTNTVTDKPTGYLGKTGIEFRGSTSQQLFPKKPYGIELWVDSTEKSRKVALLGMPEESDWVLNTSYNDKTLMRDVLSYDLANRMGRYATRTRYCEMVINGNYEGLYILMEKVKKDKNRVDVSTLKLTDNSGDDVTGGYILKIDKTEGSKSRLWNTTLTINAVNYTIPIQIEYPKITDITDAQFNYIKNYVTEFETSLKASDYLTPKAKWRDMIDIDSFVDYFLITEFTKNVDGYRLSTYFYKDKDSKGGKLKMGPAWDYNLAFGNAEYLEGYKPTGWQYKVNDLAIPAKDTYFLSPTWWERLSLDSTFRYKAAKRWEVLRKSALSPDRINNWMDSTANTLNEPKVRNFSRWTGVLGKYVWPNYYVGATYENETTWMKDWIRQRTAWLDIQLKVFGSPLANEEEIVNQLPLRVFPNPIETETTIEYEVAKKGRAKINLYDFTGKLLKTILDEDKNINTFQVKLNSENMSSGMYIVDYQLDGVHIESMRIIKK
jgi:CotH kinase protein/Secretion system C-terminal sorting domain